MTAPITIRRSSGVSGRLDESVRPTGVPSSVRVDRARRSRRPVRLAAALTAIGAVTVVVVAAVGGMAWASSPKSAAGALNPPPAPSYALGKLVSPYNVPMSDPSVMVGNGTDYLYTGAGGYEPPNISVRTFTDLEHLGNGVDAMPALPPWTTGWTSAPDVRHVNGRYVMWFSSPDIDDILATGVPAKCIGVGISTSPFGPFIVGRQPVSVTLRDPSTPVLSLHPTASSGSTGRPTSMQPGDRRRTPISLRTSQRCCGLRSSRPTA